MIIIWCHFVITNISAFYILKLGEVFVQETAVRIRCKGSLAPLEILLLFLPSYREFKSEKYFKEIF